MWWGRDDVVPPALPVEPEERPTPLGVVIGDTKRGRGAHRKGNFFSPGQRATHPPAPYATLRPRRYRNPAHKPSDDAYMLFEYESRAVEFVLGLEATEEFLCHNFTDSRRRLPFLPWSPSSPGRRGFDYLVQAPNCQPVISIPSRAIVVHGLSAGAYKFPIFAYQTIPRVTLT